MSAVDPVILGIETSCDETAAAVVRGGRDVLSNIIATQHDLHERYAGVVPEIASRAHIERITPVVREAMREAGVSFGELDAVAVGHRPGLIGSLLVGVSAAKALAWSIERPLIGVDHVAAHLHAGMLDAEPAVFPALGLVVSGGHTSLFLLHDEIRIELLGRTIDDAIGEAFDKAATILELGYPGGPEIDRLAQRGNDRAFKLPIAQLGPESLDFSFSGLKTALLYTVDPPPPRSPTAAAVATVASRARPEPIALTETNKADLAASFQRAAIAAVMKKLHRALDRFAVTTILVGGGVSANSRLRAELQQLAVERGLDVRLPKLAYCLDNAAMIAGAAAARFHRGLFDDWSLSAAAQSALT